MPNVKVSYGPPGARGVSAIMGIGVDDVEPHPATDLLKKAVWIGLGAFALGVVTSKRGLRGFGLGAAAVGLGVRYLSEKNLTAPAPASATPVPLTSVP
jgi:hypothetical protein